MGALNSTVSSEQVLGVGAAAAIAVSAAVYASKSHTPKESQAQEEKPVVSTTTSGKKERKARKKGKARDDDDGTPPALAAQTALFEISEKPTENLSKSKTRKRGRKSNTPAMVSVVPDIKVEPSIDDEEGDDESAHEIPIIAQSTSSVKGAKTKRSFNKFSTLTESHISTAPSMDASWTQVDKTRRLRVGSDAGISTTTGEDDEKPKGSPLKPLPGKLGRDKPKTVVDDMLPAEEESARVMRVVSAQDAEDMLQSTDADEEEGWGIVRRRGAPREGISTSSASIASSQPEELTKDQRKREAKKEALKAAKADAEADRLARLTQHRKEQERAKLEELVRKKEGKAGKVSGGMTAVVNSEGRLVWE